MRRFNIVRSRLRIIRAITSGTMLAVIWVDPNASADSPLPTTEEFNGALTACATGSDVNISADLLGSVTSFYSGQRSNGAASFKTATKFLELFPEGDRAKVYELYTKCISQIFHMPPIVHPSSCKLPSIESVKIVASTNVDDMWGHHHSVGLHACMIDGSSISCSFVIEALKSEATVYNVGEILAPDAKLNDNFFNEHKLARSYFLDGRCQKQERLNLLKGDRVWFIAEFDGGSGDITSTWIVLGREVLKTRIK